jgi:hypothetical protein
MRLESRCKGALRQSVVGQVEKSELFKGVNVYAKDFLSLKPTDESVKNVKTIICTPACSGSAIVNKLDHFMHEKGILVQVTG